MFGEFILATVADKQVALLEALPLYSGIPGTPSTSPGSCQDHEWAQRRIQIKQQPFISP